MFGLEMFQTSSNPWPGNLAESATSSGSRDGGKYQKLQRSFVAVPLWSKWTHWRTQEKHVLKKSTQTWANLYLLGFEPWPPALCTPSGLASVFRWLGCKGRVDKAAVGTSKRWAVERCGKYSTVANVESSHCRVLCFEGEALTQW